jgi:pyruvate,water dikinase
MMNVGNPDRAFDFAQLPNAGVGLARLEFIINRMIGVHPKALLDFDSLPPELKAEHRSGASPATLRARSISTSTSWSRASPRWPRLLAQEGDRAAVRLQVQRIRQPDRRGLYEPHEENPMLGFRGASRYISDSFRDCFELECRALKRVRDEMG